MKCHECGGDFHQERGALKLDDDLVGPYTLNDVEYMKCGRCGSVFLGPEAWELADRKEAEIMAELIGKLPVDEFISAKEAAEILGISRQAMHKHRRIRRGFIYSTMIGGRRMYHGKSTQLFLETGDGRFPLRKTVKHKDDAKYLVISNPTNTEEMKFQYREPNISPAGNDHSPQLSWSIYDDRRQGDNHSHI